MTGLFVFSTSLCFVFDEAVGQDAQTSAVLAILCVWVAATGAS